MKKSLLFLAFILLVFVLTACGEAETSAGKVDIKIYDFDSQEVFHEEVSFEEEDTLLNILVNHKDIKAKGEESSFGFYIIELKGISSNDHENTFWNIKVNGEDSMVGVSDIELVDGLVIEFRLIGW